MFHVVVLGLASESPPSLDLVLQIRHLLAYACLQLKRGHFSAYYASASGRSMLGAFILSLSFTLSMLHFKLRRPSAIHVTLLGSQRLLCL